MQNRFLILLLHLFLVNQFDIINAPEHTAHVEEQLHLEV